MTDIYHKDTRKALDKFSGTFDDIRFHLTVDYGCDFDTLYSEVDGLLDQYEEQANTIEELKEKVEELESTLQCKLQEEEDEEVAKFEY